MVRAATLGIFNFSEFDPWDLWWWKKLYWTLDELERSQSRNVLAVRHNHWVTLASCPGVTDEYFDKAKTNATTTLNKLLKATYPWRADEIGEGGTQTDTEQLLAEYRARVGRPGEPEYEERIEKLRKKLRKKLTPMEKRKWRWQREQRRQQ